MFLVEVLGSDSNSASQAHSKDLATAQKPHVISAIVRCPAGHCEAAQFKLFLSDFERHDGVVALLDDGPLDNEFYRCQALSTFRVFPVSDAEQLATLGPGQLDGTTLTGLDLLGDTPIVEAIGFWISEAGRPHLSPVRPAVFLAGLLQSYRRLLACGNTELYFFKWLYGPKVLLIES